MVPSAGAACDRADAIDYRFDNMLARQSTGRQADTPWVTRCCFETEHLSIGPSALVECSMGLHDHLTSCGDVLEYEDHIVTSGLRLKKS